MIPGVKDNTQINVMECTTSGITLFGQSVLNRNSTIDVFASTGWGLPSDCNSDVDSK